MSEPTEVILARVDERTKSLHDRMETVEKDVKSIQERVNHWRGGLGVVIAIGGIVGGSLTAIGSQIAKLFNA